MGDGSRCVRLSKVVIFWTAARSGWPLHNYSSSSWSKAFACFKSNVSKPSVNQPKTGARSSWASWRFQGGLDDPGISLGPIVSAARDQPHTIAVALDAQAIAVVFDLVKPVRAVRDGGR